MDLQANSCVVICVLQAYFLRGAFPREAPKHRGEGKSNAGVEEYWSHGPHAAALCLVPTPGFSSSVCVLNKAFQRVMLNGCLGLSN